MNKPNGQAALLQSIREACFTLHELVLYLDTHPNDRKAFAMYRTYRKKCAELTAQYENQYGPLTAGGVTGDRWTWGNGPWPWQNCQQDHPQEGGNCHVDV